VKIGPYDYNIYANNQINAMKDIDLVPLKTVGEASVLVGDVGKAKDASQIQYNKVRINGQSSVYIPVLKQGGTPTLLLSLMASNRSSRSCSTCPSGW